MKKKQVVTKKDKKDWINFAKNIKNVAPKDVDKPIENFNPKDCTLTKNDKIPAKIFFRLFFTVKFLKI